MRFVRTFAVVVVIAGFVGSAWANEGKMGKKPAATDKPPAETDKPTGDSVPRPPPKKPTTRQPAADDKASPRKRPYRSKRRIECEHSLALGQWDQGCKMEFRKDKAWRKQWQSAIKKDLKIDAHREAAKSIATNNKHVVMAYAAIWIIMAGLFVLMWVRQQKLVTEIARLESELAKETGGRDDD